MKRGARRQHRRATSPSRREAFFFDYVKDELIKEYGAQDRAPGRPARLHDDRPQEAAGRRAPRSTAASPASAPPRRSSRSTPRTATSRRWRPPADYGKSKFNLAAQGHRQPGSTFKVMALMTALRKGVDPRSTTLRLQAAEVQRPDVGPDRRPDLRARLQRLDQPRAGDAQVRQHGLRAARARPRPAGGQADRLRHGDQDPPRRLPGRGARRPHARRLAARDGQRLRDDRLRRLSQPPDRDHQDHLPRRQVRSCRGASRSSARRRSRTASPPRRRGSSSENVQAGTGTRAKIGCPAAGKTGTTDNFNDAWFVGFTPRLATAVWVGYPNAQIEMTTEYHGGSVAGGTFPAEIWGDYMKQAKGKFCGDFKPRQDEPLHFDALLRQVRAQRRPRHRRVRPPSTPVRQPRRPSPAPATPDEPSADDDNRRQRGKATEGGQRTTGTRASTRTSTSRRRRAPARGTRPGAGPRRPRLTRPRLV